MAPRLRPSISVDWTGTTMSRLSCVVLLTLAACAAPPRPRLADRLLEHGDHDGAVIAYAMALSEDPDDADLAAKYETARKIAAQAHREQADRARARGDIDRVARELRQVIELAPDDTECAAALDKIEVAQAHVRKAVAEATALLASGDAEGALGILEPHRADLGSFPEGVRAHRAASLRVRESALTRAQDALARHDFDAAKKAARRAADVPPTSPRATKLLGQADAGLEAAAIAKSAEETRGRGDYRKAISDFGRALELVPGLESALVGLKSARSDGARANLKAALRALQAKKAVEARERLRVAEELVPNTNDTDHAELAGQVREGIRAKLIEEAERHAGARRPALAHLHYAEAEALNPWRNTLEDEVARTWGDAVRALRVVVRVENLKDASGARIDELGITRSIVAHLDSVDLPAWLYIQPKDQEYSKPDVTVSGRINSFGTSFTKPVTKTRKVRYVRETKTRTNPEHAKIARRLRTADAEVRDKGIDLTAERKRLKHLVDHPWTSTRNRRYRDNPDRIEGAYDSALSVQRSRIRTAERNLDRATAAATDVRAALARTPTVLSREIHAEGRYRVTTRRGEGRAEAALSMVEAGDRLTPRNFVASAKVEFEDLETAGFAPAGIAADPNELPTEAATRDRLMTKLVARISGQMRGALETLAVRHLNAARDADAETRLEAQALFLLCGVRGSGQVRLEAEKALRAATGLTVAPLPEGDRGPEHE
jgi:tetratricopeptide (TPR) repeat protein